MAWVPEEGMRVEKGGKMELPIRKFRGEIVTTVRENLVTIITAETGAGKSTQVPQYLLEEGFTCVVTQPRRLAARTVAARVAEERGCRFGGEVGFRTAHEREDSAETRCLFVTDGLALVRELMGAGRHQVLVLDEVHEWNLNMEVLAAWSKRQIESGADYRVVVMSATLEAEKLAAYFGGAPVIRVPGRTFPVEVRHASADERGGESGLFKDVVALVKAGRNVLVFQPGKGEISALVNGLKSTNANAEILPLHGDLTPAEQTACFRRYGRPKVVVSTNVAQTSVTIEDIDAVVDSGLERRIELVDGVEGLYLKAISQADAAQRKGRAGRTKPGIYIDHCKESERPEFPKAEILRSRLDQTVLRLAEHGIDAEELRFFHQPDLKDIHDAKGALKALGCMDSSGKVTAVGRQVGRLPVSVQFGRMVVAADALGVVDDVITIAAILEQGDITVRPRERYETPAWRKLCPGEESSDVLAQFAVFKAAGSMSKDELFENGIHSKAYQQAKERRRQLENALRGRVREFRSNGNRDSILKAVCSGMVDHLYRREYDSWRNGDGATRELARESVVRGAEWLVGLPFDLQIQTRRGPAVLKLVRMCTKVDPSTLTEIAPQLVEEKTGLSPAYDSAKDVCVSTTQKFFNGMKVGETRAEDTDHAEAASLFAGWLASQMA